jgi:hypothetical protein
MAGRAPLLGGSRVRESTRESKPGIGGEGREGRGPWHPDDAPGVLLIGQGKQEVAMGAPGSLHAAALCPNEEDKLICKKPPWALEVSLENTKQHPFVLFGGSNLF